MAGPGDEPPCSRRAVTRPLSSDADGREPCAFFCGKGSSVLLPACTECCSPLVAFCSGPSVKQDYCTRLATTLPDRTHRAGASHGAAVLLLAACSGKRKCSLTATTGYQSALLCGPSVCLGPSSSSSTTAAPTKLGLHSNPFPRNRAGHALFKCWMTAGRLLVL